MQSLWQRRLRYEQTPGRTRSHSRARASNSRILWTIVLVLGAWSVGCVKPQQVRKNRVVPTHRMAPKPRSVVAKPALVRPAPRPVTRPTTLATRRTKPPRRARKRRSLWKVWLPRSRRFRKVISFFRHRRRGYIRDVLTRRKLVEARVRPVLKGQRMPWELLLLAGIESSYRMRVRSWAGAGGMWQFMPATGRRFGLHRTVWVDQRYNLRKATVAAAQYLRVLQKEFRQWEWAFAAYNCGESRVRRILKRCPGKTFWQARLMKCGIPKETRQYVARYFAVLYFLRRPMRRRRGEKWPKLRPPSMFTVRLKRPVALTTLAAQLGVSVKQLQGWNPSLISWATPPVRRFRFRVPWRYRKPLRWALKQPQVRLQVVKMRSDQSLERVAKRVNLSPSFLRAINHLPHFARVAGFRMLVPRPPKGEAWGRHSQAGLAKLAKGLLRWSRPLRSLRRRRMASHRRLRGLCYRVKAGDSWWQISRMRGLSVRRLRRYNRSRRALRRGRWLRLSPGISCARRVRARRRARAWRRGWRDGSAFLLRRPARKPRRVASRKSRRKPRRTRKSRRSRKRVSRRRRVRRGKRRISRVRKGTRRSKRRGRCHRVRRGDSVWSISKRYGLTPHRLKRLNPAARRTLRVGIWLRLRSRTRC